MSDLVEARSWLLLLVLALAWSLADREDLLP